MSNAVKEVAVSARGDRQKDLVPPEKLAITRATVVGVGAVGRQVALQLSAMGVPEIVLVDFDTVEEANLGPQGYWHADLGEAKVVATGALCEAQNPDAQVDKINGRVCMADIDRYFREGAINCIFCCVDSIKTRGLIWKIAKDCAIAFFVDGRMAAESLRMLTSDHPLVDEYYATTLFTEEEAYRGSCTAKSTIYSSAVLGGLMVGSYAKWLRGLPLDKDVSVNLLSLDMVVNDPS